jgi:tetratricopeptide (TPR) repeat protein/tRNA A-37 threonylcarbamoyl transferase component Bud32
MSSTASSTFAITCPGCGQRLRFELAAGGPPRVRIHCAACDREFGVRRPGAPPMLAGGAEVAGTAGVATGTAGVAGAGGSAEDSRVAGTAAIAGAAASAGSAEAANPSATSGTAATGAAASAAGAAGTVLGGGAGVAAGMGVAAGASTGTTASAASGRPPTVIGIPVPPAGLPPADSVPPTHLSPRSPQAAAAVSRQPVFAPAAIVAGRYRVVRFLAQGGMGEVYEVDDLELRERVALKTVRPEVAGDSLAVERFRREIQMARKVTHPNVCRIFDVSYHRSAGAGTGLDGILLTMELLTGETLAQRLRNGGPLPTSEALPIARQICLGLEAAHQVGVIHRDLKPGNVVLVPARGGVRAVVTDFGLARLESGHDPGAPTLTTAGGGLVGTPAYLAPEQLEGGEITTAVDVYALGIVLYEMATGTVPFVGDSLLATAVKRLKEAPVSPRVHAPNLDRRWEAAILRCLEREPGARYASPLEVIATLTGTAAGEGLEAGAADSSRAASMGGAGGGPVPGSFPDGWGTHPSGASAGDPPAGAATSLPAAAAASAAAPSLPGVPLPGGDPPGATGFGATSNLGPGPPAASPLLAAAGLASAVPRPRRRLAAGALITLILASFAVAYYRFSAWRESRAEAEHRLGAPSAEVIPRRSVAVLGFKDLSGAGDAGWLSPALAEMLSTELGAGGALRIIAGEDVARVKLELKLGQPASLARDTLRRIRTLLGSDAVVLGSYLVVGGGAGARQIRLDLRLQDAQTGETTALTESGTEAGLFQLVAQAGERLRRELRAGGAAPSRPALAASPEAARLYSEGMQKLRLFDPVGARDLLAQAVAADPGSAAAHAGLAGAWAALGYDGKARTEAKAAFELSADLPAQERLLIEGRYRETTGDWGAAVDIYRRLYALFPDSLDHGLRLAAAQIAAGRPQEALATAATLRALPEPSRDDPRIDLSEATAAGARSDFQRQHAAAGRAAERAAALGASLLVAQARLLDCRALRNLGRADDALAACAAGQRLHAAAGDRSGVAEALTHSANVHFDRGDLPGARRLYEQALATYREIGSRGAEAGVLNNIAVVLRSQGELERARELYEQVLAIARELGSRDAEAYALNNLAGVMLRRGDLDGAAGLYQQSLAIRQELGDAAGVAYALDNLGVALRRRGDLAGARRRHDEALAIRRRTGQKIGEAASLDNLGSVLLDQGDLAGARRQFEAALATSRAIGSQTFSAYALFGLGEVLSRLGSLDDARRDHQAALGLRSGLGEKGTAAESRLALAELDLAAARAGAAPATPAAMAAIAAEAEAAAGELAHQAAADAEARALSLSAIAAGAAGDARRARAAIDRATALLQASPAAPASQDLRVRLTVAVRAASLMPASQERQAAAALAAARDDATRSGLLELRLEAELALAERARASGPPATARALAAVLLPEARAGGYALIDARAAALAANSAARPAPSARPR